MAQSRVEGSQALRNVLFFTLKLWSVRRPLLAVIALAMLFSTLTEVIVPIFAGHLVDALEQGPSAIRASLGAFGAMAALGLLMVLLRHLAWGGMVPLTLSASAFDRARDEPHPGVRARAHCGGRQPRDATVQIPRAIQAAV